MLEADKDTITVNQWKEIYEKEKRTDRCEEIANILECIALNHK
jgi:uncharacterized protein Yka (UPF0111/DUF47 family)